MALIKVGIHENLTFSDKTQINDKGTLELCIKSVDDPNALLNAFESSESFSQMESSFRFYPPNLKDFDQNIKTAAEVAQDVLKLRAQFLIYAKLVATKEEAEKALGGLAMFKGLGIPDDKIKAAIGMFNQEDFMKKVVTNLSTIFIKFLESKKAFSGTVLFRHKFLRQSKAKNYAVIPSSDFDTWVESMDIPKSASKIAYSQWEIDNGKDQADPVSSDPSVSTEADANKASTLFAAPVAPAETTDAIPAETPDTVKPDLFAKE